MAGFTNKPAVAKEDVVPDFDIKKAVLALLVKTGLSVEDFQIIEGPPPPLTGANFGAQIVPGVQEYVDTLTEAQRVGADLPKEGVVLVWDDDSQEQAHPEDLRNMIRAAQNYNWANMQALYTIAATFVRDASGAWGGGGPQVAIPDTIVFAPGMRHGGVLQAIKDRVAGGKNANPNQKFPQ